MSAIIQQNVTTFDFRISKKLTFFVFKHELTNYHVLYKDDFTSQTNRILDSNSLINYRDFLGRRENESNRQMFKTPYIFKINSFEIIKDIYN